MPDFDIAGLIITIDSDNPEMLKDLHDFSSEQNQRPDLNILLKAVDSIEEPHGITMFNERVKWLRKPEEGNGYYFYIDGPDRILSLADVDMKWKHGVVTYLDSELDKKRITIYTHSLLGMIFRYALLRFQGIAIHASTIKWNGKGIAFSAPSGTGKSTHVRLWQEYIGPEVRVLNDDAPVVRLVDNLPYIFGNPWSGSANIHCNEKAPLAAIVLLEQSSQNSIKCLSIDEAVHSIIPRLFLPYFDSELMNMALVTFERVVSLVPVYLLKCLPDHEAVELVYQCVK